MFSQTVNFSACLLVMQFYCQLEIRYHVTRAEVLLRRLGNIQDGHCLIIVAFVCCVICVSWVRFVICSELQLRATFVTLLKSGLVLHLSYEKISWPR